MTSHLSRRSFHAVFGGALGTGLFAVAAPRRRRAATTEITVLNWKGYGTDEAFALKDFADGDRHHGQARLFQCRSRKC